MEREKQGIREGLVSSSFWSDTDGILTRFDVFSGFVDDFRSVDKIPLNDGKITGFAKPISGDRNLEVGLFRDEEDAVMAENINQGKLVKNG